MASSKVNQVEKSDNQASKFAEESSKTLDENNEVKPRLSSNVEETIDEQFVKIDKQHITGISTLAKKRADSTLTKIPIVSQARPFDEFAIQQPNSDVPPETNIKLNENKFISTGRLS